MALAEPQSPFAVRLSELVQEATHRRGVLKKELARACGVRPDELSKLQSGRRRPIHRAAVLRIARGLGLDQTATDALLDAAGFAPVEPADAWQPKGVRAEFELGVADAEPEASLGVDTRDATSLLVGVARLAHERLAMQLAALSVTYTQALVLTRLARAGGSLPPSRLVDALGPDRTTTAMTLAQLETRGLVSRRIREVVSGRVIFSLTPAGKALEGPIRSKFNDVEAAILASLDAAYRPIARDLLAQMLAGLAAGRTE
jgi:MarR family transcriptional regulator, organic hydroperoxide resistance regulator